MCLKAGNVNADEKLSRKKQCLVITDMVFCDHGDISVEPVRYRPFL